ncbi:uncharacterized protein MAM_07815 [Metarhizium album ARSEF 1941]|uniref:Uncharacterized protein n=1 Tax=Metarhizium album (strain ARSEF 1941) TaxID=1081103 RepID=A0A0B2WEM9_METAS|nr:uncharacterized protein MAM_07815 [Metarhizium album ARSEF 1941]KHN94286.1 hypothetical protein MAM_07815 [Metarhizium album ARSEF 1941]
MPKEQNTLSSLNSETSSIPQTGVVSPTRATKSKRVLRDTGFPEYFRNGPNTTLPHPEADLSPNAMLSYEDVSEERMIKRHWRSFLRKHKRTVSHGVINSQSEALNSSASLSTLDFDGNTAKQLRSTSTTSIRLSKDGGESIRSGSKKYEEDTPPTSPDVAERRRKPRLFGRLKRP